MRPERHGVPDEVLRELGAVVVSSGFIEQVSIDIGEIFLVVGAEKKNHKQLCDDITRRLQSFGVPPWARCDSTQVEQFLGQAVDVMAERNTLFHAYHYRIAGDNSDALTRQHLKSGVATPVDAAEIAELVLRIDRVNEVGEQRRLDLMHLIRPDGVYMRDRESPNGSPSVIQMARDLNMTRITKEEADEYWTSWDAMQHAAWPPTA